MVRNKASLIMELISERKGMMELLITEQFMHSLESQVNHAVQTHTFQMQDYRYLKEAMGIPCETRH